MATDETLAWEARRRPQAAILAAAASILSVGSFVAYGLALKDAPRAPVLESFARLAQPGPIGPQPSLRTPFHEYYTDHALAILASSFGRALGFLFLALTLAFLAMAVRARTRMPKIAFYLPLVGGGMLVLSEILLHVGLWTTSNSFLDGSRTIDSTEGSPLPLVAQLIGFQGGLGGVTIGAGFILVSLHAMRAGLLTRFLGILGMLGGGLTLLPIASPLPVVPAFWLSAIALLLSGRWPGGDPPAWVTGRAEPWPSQQQVREAREASRERGEEPSPSAPVAVAAAPAPPRPAHPASKKRKRKRRA